MADDNCSASGCEKTAAMQCPKCLELKIDEGSHFCSQECFKANWTEHKRVHKRAKLAAKLNAGPMTWPGYRFTGPLRPYPQSPTRKVPEHIVRPDYHLDGVPRGEREAKSARHLVALGPKDIETMREVCRLGREVLDEASKAIAVGVTTDEIDRVVHEASIERDCYPSPLNYMNFPKSCCTSVNEVICHGIPDGYKLQEGDIVNVDVTVYKHGFHGDLNETFFVGKVDEESARLTKVTYECLQKSIAACKPGMRYRDVGDIISKHAHANGFSVIRSYCGHGINQLFHTTPSIPHYAKNKAFGVMKPGHTFTIEPMIAAGTWHDDQWPDSWTAVTKDGKRSAQFEHTLLITEDGCDILTKRLDSSPTGPQWFETA
eukprot:m.92634 g.92634  ORF g.92634 m.92634 type:complete len:374 (+) comp15071_c0_seq6:123-1244(+)